MANSASSCFSRAGYIPLLLHAHRRDETVDRLVHHVAANGGNGFRDVLLAEQVVALLVNNLALVVGHVVVFQQLLADIEVATLDLALRLFDGIGHHAVLYRLALFHAQGLHKTLHPIGGEDTHQVVFQRQVETRQARIALPARSAAQLVVDTPGLMPLGAQDMQATGVQYLLVPLLPG